MPYTQRDEAGNVSGLFANPQDHATEYLSDSDPAVIAFQQAVVSTQATPASMQDQIIALAARVSALEAKIA